jgi:hypothetical protein
MEYGIDRHAISPAIRELEALGFVEVTQRGKPSAGDLRWPNFFRLTCVNSKSSPTPSHEWRRIKTREDAELLARAARKAKGKNRIPVRQTPTVPMGETPTVTLNSQCGNPPLLAQCWKPPLPLYLG